MSNYQQQQQYVGYPPMQGQPRQSQGYPPPNVSYFNTNQEYQFAAEQDISDISKDNVNVQAPVQIHLVDGHYVVDCLVSSNFLSNVPRKDDKEFTHMRYTACTCDPDNFQGDKYTLRQEKYKRQTELFIGITMYNESVVLFARTFHSVVKNIVHLCSREKSRMWGEDGWKKVVICIVSDGRNLIDEHVLAYLAVIGVYQDGVAKNQVIGRDVSAHIYEYTTQLSIDPEIKELTDVHVPIQVIFCLKEKQARKINSHRWFFNAFGPILKPNVCVLLDVGTKPGGTSIYHLWKAFNLNKNVAGACGEIVAMKGKAGVNLINPIVAAQNYEYKMSNILDKPLESVFGYITVLPGAFSAYRYDALQNVNGEGPLASYFLGEVQQGENAGIFKANMYLAEDRILCFELVVKHNSSWVLHYVKSAYAETDVPDKIPELVLQRRRWLNGSFFTGVYSICHTFSIWRSNHSFFRKILLHIEMAYQAFNLIFSWFALGNFFLAFYIFSKALTQPEVVDGKLWNEKTGEIIFEVLQYVYLSLLIVQFIHAMGNKPQDSKWIYIFSITIYAGFMMYLLFAASWITYKGFEKKKLEKFSINNFINTEATLWNIIFSVASTYGIYFLSSLMFFEPWHMFSSSAQYLLLIPFYVNIISVYAFCNIHDVSWGTKGDTSAKYDLGVVKATEKGEVEVESEPIDINAAYEEASNKLARHTEEVKPRSKAEKKGSYNRSFRTHVVLFWLISNAALVIGITKGDEALNSVILDPQQRSNYYMLALLWSVTGMAAFRFIGSCIFLLARAFTGN